MILIRSLLFNIVYYLATAVMVVGSLPLFVFDPESGGERTVRAWSRVGVYLLRVIVGTRLVVRGLDTLPPGGVIIASKHQSMFETFALYSVLDRPTFVMKSELSRVPLWGWYARRVGMIAVERDDGPSALRKLAVDVEETLKREKQIIIFPEGTRRPPGAEPAYKGGIAYLYRKAGTAVVPVALNSGLFWPRRHFLRYPGTIVVEFLPAIPPGLKSQEFLSRLENDIETASTKLLTEAANDSPPPALLPDALARLKQRRNT